MPEHEVERRGVPLSVALGSLPLDRPSRDGWPLLAQRLRSRQRQRRLRWSLAAAAVLTLGLLLPRAFLPAPPPPVQLVESDAVASELALLKRTSGLLEALLREVGGEGEDAGTAMLQARLLDEVAGIDALLASSPTSPEIERWLWSERVLRLQRLAGLGGRAGLLAAREFDAEDAHPIY